MNINQLFQLLGVEKDPSDYESDRGHYELNLSNSDDYNKMYWKLDLTDIFSQDSNDFILTPEKNSVVFFNDAFNIELTADFENDNYIIDIYEVR